MQMAQWKAPRKARTDVSVTSATTPSTPTDGREALGHEPLDVRPDPLPRTRWQLGPAGGLILGLMLGAYLWALLILLF